MDPLGIGVIGCGHWGKNHLRVFNSLKETVVHSVGDPDESRTAWSQEQFPQVPVVADGQQVIDADGVDAVVVATPAASHTRWVRSALEAGKHVLCEKPLTLNAEEGQALVELAARQERILMVGHIFLYNPGICYLKQELERGGAGKLLYLDAVRTNLGPVRDDVGALYDLATHDVSVFNYLVGTAPTEVQAAGASLLGGKHEDLAFLTLRYPGGELAHAHVSWMNPRKVRQMTAVGDERMIIWDDLRPQEVIRIHDKGIEPTPKEHSTFGDFHLLLRDGDIRIPRVQLYEPLTAQARHFVESVRENKAPKTDGANGVAVVRVLEAALESLERGGWVSV